MRGGTRRNSSYRAAVSAVAALFLVLASALIVPPHALGTTLRADVSVPHSGADALAAHDSHEQQADGGDCEDHHPVHAHGQTCCQISCHAALPAMALPLLLPRTGNAIRETVPTLSAPERVVLLDRPPIERA
jgi:hypothetical protein